VKLPSSSTYAFWLALARIGTGVFWLSHGIPKFAQSVAYLPPKGTFSAFLTSALAQTHGVYHTFLAHTVAANPLLFANIVRGGEVFAGFLLLFGANTRLGAAIGFALALSVIFAKGGASHISAWSGTEGLLAILCVLNLVLPTGRILGAEGFAERRARKYFQERPVHVSPEFVDEQPMTGPSAPKD